MSKNRETCYDVNAFKAAVKVMFTSLRKLGYTCRMNFMCCGGCAAAELADKPLYVFYHRQNNESLEMGEGVYLSWKGDGNVIVQEAKKADFIVDWDGTEGMCINLAGLNHFEQDFEDAIIEDHRRTDARKTFRYYQPNNGWVEFAGLTTANEKSRMNYKVEEFDENTQSWVAWN